MINSLLTLMLALLLGGPVAFNKTVHDFGAVSRSDGPLSCNFEVTNTGEEDLTIFAVVSSCGCTDVSWTREAIKPGEKGTISATYTNDEGPYPFDKAITVYTSADKRPVILHIKGVVDEAKAAKLKKDGSKNKKKK